MIHEYLQGPNLEETRDLLKSAKKGATLTPAQKTSVRDCLMVTLLLSNFKRAGDIRHLLQQQVDDVATDGPVELKVNLNMIR